MATANVTNDLEHFVTCGVCLCEFDEKNRKPKFLQCAHTFCLKCLREICRAGVITCPICRTTFFSDTASLPNNSYALQMVKLKQEREKPKVTAVSSLECRTYGSVGNAGMVEQTKKLTAVLKKRKEVQGRLDAIMKSITAVGDQVKQLQEENNIEMAELINSLIEVTPRPTESSSLQDKLQFGLMMAKLSLSVRQPYVFILKVFNNGTSIGEIRIRPALTFHPGFVHTLRQFCYKSPKAFASTVDKAQAGLFVSISMSHTLSFQPTLGTVNWDGTSRINASKMGEVGLIFKKKGGQPVGDGLNTVTDWNLFIPLNPVNIQEKNPVTSAGAELFGHIVDTSNYPNEAITELSKSKKNERWRYTMTLELVSVI